MPTVLMGKDAKIYEGVAAAALGALTEMSNVKDVKLNLSAGEADTTTRSNSGWRATSPGLRECQVEFEMLWLDTDACFVAMKAAFLAGTTVELAILDRDRATGGANGPKGAFAITGFVRNEGLEEAISVSVTAKMATFTEWVSV